MRNLVLDVVQSIGYIGFSYLISGVLILALIFHTIWRGRNIKKQIETLTCQQDAQPVTQPSEKSD